MKKFFSSLGVLVLIVALSFGASVAYDKYLRPEENKVEVSEVDSSDILRGSLLVSDNEVESFNLSYLDIESIADIANKNLVASNKASSGGYYSGYSSGGYSGGSSYYDDSSSGSGWTGGEWEGEVEISEEFYSNYCSSCGTVYYDRGLCPNCGNGTWN